LTEGDLRAAKIFTFAIDPSDTTVERHLRVIWESDIQFVQKAAVTRGTFYDDPQRRGQWRPAGHLVVSWWRPGPGIDLLWPFKEVVAGALRLDLHAPYTKLARITMEFELDGQTVSANCTEPPQAGMYARLSGSVAGRAATIWVWLSSLPAPQELAGDQAS
jgi:hypothetical protein